MGYHIPFNATADEHIYTTQLELFNCEEDMEWDVMSLVSYLSMNRVVFSIHYMKRVKFNFLYGICLICAKWTLQYCNPEGTRKIISLHFKLGLYVYTDVLTNPDKFKVLLKWCGLRYTKYAW